MSEQPLDLRRFFWIVWRHKIIVEVFAALGLAVGLVFTMHYPPLRASKALVELSPEVHDTSTQRVIASSDPVLADAVRSADPGMSIEALRSRVQVSSVSYNVIAITAQGKTASQAERTANAVARSYVNYLASGKTPFPSVPAVVLQPARNATGTPVPLGMLIAGGIGALSGLLMGAVAALAIGRGDQRLRTRDEIAESIGVPVLASIHVSHPSSTASWRTLLEEYEPGDVDAWRLRKVLQHLDLAESNGSGASLTVLSLSSDRKALALGPQVAAFAASMQIPAALVISAHQDANAAATLRAACAAPWAPRRSGNLQVAVSDNGEADQVHGARLTVAVSVLDGRQPTVAGTMHTGATVLGVSAGAATAEQLARVAASAAADGRYISGILVGDPESGDHTTGRLPQLARPARWRTPPRRTGTATEARP